jgi:hypothetical protein
MLGTTIFYKLYLKIEFATRGCFCKKYIGGANNLLEADVIVMGSGVTK